MLNSSKAIHATEGNDKGKGNEATVIFLRNKYAHFSMNIWIKENLEIV